ncbi:MAG: mechanosensitive ion channel family protein, partial [Acidobacteriota bacterium]|nr:mechanosensitive ion channel family protein [Acidobacteriota bacterium]
AIGDEITDRVKDEFDRLGIEIPYATRDLYIRSMPATLATKGLSEAPGAVVDSPDGQDQKAGRETKQGKADE